MQPDSSGRVTLFGDSSNAPRRTEQPYETRIGAADIQHIEHLLLSDDTSVPSNSHRINNQHRARRRPAQEVFIYTSMFQTYTTPPSGRKFMLQSRFTEAHSTDTLALLNGPGVCTADAARPEATPQQQQGQQARCITGWSCQPRHLALRRLRLPGEQGLGGGVLCKSWLCI